MTEPIAPTPAGAPTVSSIRTGNSVADLKQAFVDNLVCALGRGPKLATRHDLYAALAFTVRDRVLDRGMQTIRALAGPSSRVVAYLSAEFLPGPHLMNNLLNLGITEPMRQALAELELDLDQLAEEEEEPGLGNGGLGRLASCYMDSMASLDVPAIGYGIRYEFGIFDQAIKDGWQAEVTDKWLRNGNPWEIPRPEVACEVQFGGHTEKRIDDHGRLQRPLGAPRRGEGRGLRHADPRLPRAHLQHAPAVEGRSRGVVRLRGLQPRRLLPGRGAQDGLREHHEGALPERRDRAGQDPAAAAAVLLRELLPAGHDPAAPDPGPAGWSGSTKRGPSSSTTPTRPSPWRN